MKLTHLTTLLALTSALLGSPTSLAQGGNASNGAAGSVALATFSVIAAPIAASATASGKGADAASGAAAVISGVFVITAVSAASDVLTLLMEAPANASNAANAGSKVSVKMSKAASEAVGASVGTTVTAVSETLGTALVVSGKVLAFIPNELGKALIYQSRVPAAK
jgi:hypothetical protein